MLLQLHPSGDWMMHRPMQYFRSVARLIGLCAMALAGPSMAQSTEGSDGETIISNIWIRPGKCNLGTAAKVDLAALAREPASWVGKCVAVSGFWYHRALYLTKEEARSAYVASQPERRGPVVGIYTSDEISASAPKSPRRFTAVGMAGECGRLWQGSIMVMGYCHYYMDAPYIAVAEMHRH
jgi:hypothetical protein